MIKVCYQFNVVSKWYKDLKQDYTEYKLNESIMAVIIDILTVLENLGVQFDYELIISKLITYSNCNSPDSSLLESRNSMKIAV